VSRIPSRARSPLEGSGSRVSLDQISERPRYRERSETLPEPAGTVTLDNYHSLRRNTFDEEKAFVRLTHLESFPPLPIPQPQFLKPNIRVILHQMQMQQLRMVVKSYQRRLHRGTPVEDGGGDVADAGPDDEANGRDGAGEEGGRVGGA